jgi:hypothetical protein
MEQWRTIFRRGAVWLLERWRVSGGAVLAAVLALFILISCQVAQACSPGMEHGMHSPHTHNTLVNLPHKPRPAASIASTVAPFGFITSSSIGTAHGGGENAHSCPCGCQTGCCSAGSAAIDVTISSLDLPNHSDPRLCAGLTSLASHEPTPQFRPPRIGI